MDRRLRGHASPKVLVSPQQASQEHVGGAPLRPVSIAGVEELDLLDDEAANVIDLALGGGGVGYPVHGTLSKSLRISIKMCVEA